MVLTLKQFELILITKRSEIFFVLVRTGIQAQISNVLVCICKIFLSNPAVSYIQVSILGHCSGNLLSYNSHSSTTNCANCLFSDHFLSYIIPTIIHPSTRSNDHFLNELCRTTRNRVICLLRESKANYFYNFFQKHNNNMKQLWPGIKSVITIRH